MIGASGCLNKCHPNSRKLFDAVNVSMQRRQIRKISKTDIHANFIGEASGLVGVIAVGQRGDKMDDLISRQDVIDACTDRHGICIAKQRLLELPSVQPEREKGKWLKAGTRMGIPLFECSLCECGDEVPTVMGKPSYNFCPYCGADMRGCDSDD